MSAFVSARPLAAALLITALLAPAAATAQAAAAPSASPPTLREALDAAWRLSPALRAAGDRLAEAQARESATDRLLSGAPTAVLSHRTDRPRANEGLREWEAEVELPLWNPGVRDATRRQTGAEREALEPALQLARLKLAGELADIAAMAGTARNELAAAERKLAEARVLAADVARRVRAGDLARIDGLQADAAVQQAAAAVAASTASLARQRLRWTALTGLAEVAELAEMADPPSTAQAGTEHPALVSARSQVRAAQARLRLAEVDRRDPVSVGIGVVRERPAFGAAAENTVRLALRVPLGSDARNAPRLAAARAELATAEAEAEAAERQLRADEAAARAELTAAREALARASERARLATEAQALIARAFQLGNLDLPSRLRADSERFDADLSEARARLELARAVQQLRQALGQTP